MTEIAPVTLTPPPRRRWTGILLLGGVFLSGLVCGAGLAAVGIRRAARQAIQRPELRVRRASRWLTRRLDLDASQQSRVRAILEGQEAEFEALRREFWPRARGRLERTEREIARTLGPAQLPKWRRMVERLRRNWDASPASAPARD